MLCQQMKTNLYTSMHIYIYIYIYILAVPGHAFNTKKPILSRHARFALLVRGLRGNYYFFICLF